MLRYGDMWFRPRLSVCTLVCSALMVTQGAAQSQIFFGSADSGTSGLTSGLRAAPGTSATPGLSVSPGRFYYFNQPGTGFYHPNPYAPAFPANPVTMQGSFQFGGLGARSGYWRAPSGYYYPWCQPVYQQGEQHSLRQPILLTEKGVPTTSNPPAETMLEDAKLYLEDQFVNKKISATDYDHLAKRLSNLVAKFKQLPKPASAEGERQAEVSEQETNLRNEFANFSSDVSRCTQPQ